MRRCAIAALVLLWMGQARADQGAPVYQAVPAYPLQGGSCGPAPRVQIEAQSGGKMWVCVAGVWEQMAAGGGGTPGGSSTQVQFNDAGSFAGSAGLTYDKATQALSAKATAAGSSTARGLDARFGEIPAAQDFGASGSKTATTGSITAATNQLTVASAVDFKVGQGIQVVGAGAAGALLASSVGAINGTTFTLAGNAGTTVSGAVVRHDDTAAIQSAVDAMSALVLANQGTGSGDVRLPLGRYYTSAAIKLKDGVRLVGAGAMVLYSKPASSVNAWVLRGNQVGLGGTVISQMSPSTDVILIQQQDASAQPLARVGVADLALTFGGGADGTPQSAGMATGHGIEATQPASGTNRRNSVIGADLRNVIVYAHDGDHYAWRLEGVNTSTFGSLLSYGGGGVHFKAPDGNSTFGGTIQILWQNPGTAYGFWADGTSPLQGSLNINWFSFVQVNSDFGGTTPSSTSRFKWSASGGMNVVSVLDSENFSGAPAADSTDGANLTILSRHGVPEISVGAATGISDGLAGWTAHKGNSQRLDAKGFSVSSGSIFGGSTVWAVDFQGMQRFYASPALPTCAAAENYIDQVQEGALARQNGGTGGSETTLCLCESNGAGTPSYRWRNLATNSVGTSTTCPTGLLVPAAGGGTGLATAALGSLLLANPANTWTAMAVGTSTQVLKGGTVPAWGAVATSELSGTITNAQLASTYSGVGACGASTWASTLSGNAAPTCTQPGFSNLSGSASASQLPALTASTLGAVTGTGTSLVCSGTDKVTGFAAGGALQCGADQAGSGGYVLVQDEGVGLTQRGILNFTGSGVACADDPGGNRTNCAVSGAGGLNTYVQYNDGGALGGDTNFTWNKTTKVLNLIGNLTLDPTGSSEASPRVLGFSPFPAGTAVQLQVGDVNHGWKLGSGRRLQMYGYFGLEVWGTRTASGPPAYASGATTDPSLSVMGTQVGNVVLNAEGPTGQTGDLQTWKVNGAKKAAVDKDGSFAWAASGTLATCAAGYEGTAARQSGGTSGSETTVCMCESDGAATPAYRWRNLATNSLGTATTCPTGLLVPASGGGTGLSAAAIDSLLLANPANTWTAAALPSCSDAINSKLLYNTTTHAFSCGTDQTSAGGGYATVQEEGTALTQRNTLNFIGPRITCADNAGLTKTDCTVSAAPLTSGTSVLKGDGSGGTATATAGTDYSAGTAALATGMLKSTTTTGALSIGVSGTDYAPGTSGNATGLVISTTITGALTAYGGTSCTNQFNRSLDASGAATCAGVGVADFTPNQGTATTVLHGNAAGQPSFGAVALGTDVSGILPLANLADGATAGKPLVAGGAGDPSYAASLAVGGGGTGNTTIAADQVFVGTAADTLTAKSIPDCAAPSYLRYDTTTHAFSCEAPPMDVAAFYPGKPANSATMMRIRFASAVRLPASLTGSVFYVAVNPTATLVLDLRKRLSGSTSSSVGSLSISTAGAFTPTFSTQTDFAAGDHLEVVNAASADATAADFSLTFLGTRIP